MFRQHSTARALVATRTVRAAVGGLVCAVALLGGCAAAGDRRGERADPPWSLGPEQPPSGEVLVSEACRDVPRRARYVSTIEGVSRLLLTSREPADAASGADSGGWTISQVEADAPLASAAHPTLDPEPIERTRATLTTTLGAAEGFRIVRSTENADAVFTTFQPPLIAMPASLRPGAGPQRQECSMVVRPIDHPDRIKAQGKATQEITYEADQAVRTPAGEFFCQRISTSFTATLGPANVRVETHAWYSRGIGLVAEESHEQVWTFGIPLRANREGWALAWFEPVVRSPAQAKPKQASGN